PARQAHRGKRGERLVASGLTRADLETTIARWRNRITLFREESIPLVGEVEKLASQYNKVTGGLTAEWDGERLPPPRMRPFASSGDRAVREKAFRAFFKPYIDVHDELAETFGGMFGLRAQIEKNAHS